MASSSGVKTTGVGYNERESAYFMMAAPGARRQWVLLFIPSFIAHIPTVSVIVAKSP